MKDIITKKILFISALPWELSIVKNLWENQSSKHLEADFLVTGMWIQNTLKVWGERLSQCNYDFVINIWVCGYRSEKQNCVQVIWSIEKKSWKEIMVPVFFEHAPLISILCSETPVYHFENQLYVDMESYGIEELCEKYRVPRIILKVPIDKVWEQTKNFDKNTALKTLETNIDMQKLISQIEKHLSSLPKKHDIKKYSSHYSFTFSENIIFERYFHKYISVLQEDFWEFFTTHKHLTKKEFLKTISHKLNNYSLS